MCSRWLDKQVKPSVTCTTGKANTVTAEALLQACQDGEIGGSNAPCSYLQGCTDTVSNFHTKYMKHVVSYKSQLHFALLTHHARTCKAALALRPKACCVSQLHLIMLLSSYALYPSYTCTGLIICTMLYPAKICLHTASCVIQLRSMLKGCTDTVSTPVQIARSSLYLTITPA